jgi:hypothetical protein
MQAARLLALVVAVSACFGCDEPDAARQVTSAPVPSAPIARPSAVRGTAVVSRPATLQRELADRFALDVPGLSRSFGVTVTDFSGLPLLAADNVDEAGPLRVAFVAGPERTEVVVAVPLRAPDRLLLAATGGEGARFRAVRRGSVDFLEPTRPAPGRALAVATNHLVVGESAAAVASVAEFLGDPASVTFAAGRDDGPRVRGELPLDVLARLAAPLAAATTWLSLAPLPDGLAESLAPTGPVTFDAELDDAGIRCELGGSTARASELFEVGPIDALLDLPADSQLALTVFLTKQARTADAGSAEGVLSGVVGADAAGRLRTGLEKLADARGARTALAFESGTRGPMMYGTLALSDAASAEAAVADVVKALDAGDEPALEGKAKITAKKTVIERVGDAYRVRVVTAEGAASTIALRFENDRLLVAAAVDPDVALRKLRGDGGSAPALRDVPAALAAARAVGAADASLVLFADPERLSLSRPVGDATEARSALVVAVTVDGRTITLRAFADSAAVRALARAATR